MRKLLPQISLLTMHCLFNLQLSTETLKSVVGACSPRQLHNLCVHVLKLSSNTVPTMWPVLWPYLLEFVMVVEFTDVTALLCTTISSVLTKIKSRDNSAPDATVGGENFDTVPSNLTVDFTQHKGAPSPVALFTRLLVLLGWPLRDELRGRAVLCVMSHLAGVIHPSLTALWDLVLPSMVAYLDQHKANDTEVSVRFDTEGRFEQSRWEDLTLKMLAKSIDQVGDEKWTLGIIRSLKEQLPLYDRCTEERAFLFACLGLTLSKVDTPDVVLENIEFVYHSIQHHLSIEQKFCALFFGQVSSTYPELVFVFLAKAHAQLDQEVDRTGCHGDQHHDNHQQQQLADAMHVESIKPLAVTAPGMEASMGSVSRRLSKLFRSSSHFSAAGSGSSRAPEPVSSSTTTSSSRAKPNQPAFSVEQVKSSLLWAYACSFQSADFSVAAGHLRPVLANVIGPAVCRSANRTGVDLRLAAIGCLGHLTRVLDAQASGAPSLFDLPAIGDELMGHLVECVQGKASGSAVEETPLGRRADNSDDQVVGFQTSTVPVATVELGDLAVRLTALVVAMDVVRLGRRENMRLTGLLSATVASTLWLPDCEAFGQDTFLNWLTVYQQTPLTVSSIFAEENRPVLMLRHDHSSAIETAALVSRLSAMCVCAFYCCWRHLLRLFCSDQLVTDMVKAVLPSLQSQQAHIRRRSARLLSGILIDLAGESSTITKLGTGISVVGQLLGHVVYLSGDQRDEATQRQAREILLQLLAVQRAQVTYVQLNKGSAFANSLDATGSCPTWIADLAILDELVVSLPKNQIFPLVRLIFSGVRYYFVESAPGGIQPILELDEEGPSSAGNGIDSPARENDPKGVSGASSPKSLFCRRLQSLNIPPGEAGRLLVLLSVLFHNRSGDLTESQVAFIINSAVKVLKLLSNRALRAAFLLGIAELGHCWPIVCLQAVVSNSLPLDIHWSVLLAAVTFLPAGQGRSSFDEVQSYSTASKEAEAEASQQQMHHHLSLLMHTLQRLEYAVPFEKREILVDPRLIQEGAATGSSPAYASDELSTCVRQTRFATHAWLSLINGLQILSLPVSVTSLIDYPSTSHGSAAYRLMARRASSSASGSPSTDLFFDGVDRQSVKALWSNIDSLQLNRKLFCRLLGQWLVALSMAAVCHTPTGKSYENRSGAEAKLALNVSPISIVVEGLNCFLLASGLRRTALHRDKADNLANNSQSGFAAAEDSSQLTDPSNLTAYIASITQDLAKQRPPDYLLGLVHFFIHQLSSSNEMNRLAAVTVICTALSHQCLPVLATHSTEASAFAQGLHSRLPSEATPDNFLDHLLRQLSDPVPTVRLAILTGLGQLVPACTPASGDDDGGDSKDSEDSDYVLFHKSSVRGTLLCITSTAHVALVHRHATAIISRLVQAADLHENQDNPVFLLTALTSLTRLVLYFREPQLRCLLAGLSQRLLSFYIHPSDAVRAAAFRLFGRLVSFAWEDNRVPVSQPTALKSQLTASRLVLLCEAETVFTSVVLHLSDSSGPVVSACKATLLTIAALLFACDSTAEGADQTESSEVSDGQHVLHFLHNWRYPKSDIHLAEFYNRLARVIVEYLPHKAIDYAMRCTVFFRSDWSNIQCSALLFAGSLMSNFTEDMRSNFPRAQVAQELMQMLRSGSTELRTAVAGAIGRLHWF